MRLSVGLFLVMDVGGKNKDDRSQRQAKGFFFCFRDRIWRDGGQSPRGFFSVGCCLVAGHVGVKMGAADSESRPT